MEEQHKCTVFVTVTGHKKQMKKINKQAYLAIFTFLALIILLAIQVNWIFKAAKFEEKNFNSKVSNALIEARKEIGNSASECNDMKNYLCGKPCQMAVRNNKIDEIDKIIKSKLEVYHIDLAYTFEITDSVFIAPNNKKIWGPKCYLQSLNGTLEKDGIKIRLQFPNRNQFLLEQIKGAFLLALFSVLFVMVSFFLTYRMFRKEQEMVQHTSDFINNMVHEFQTPLANIRFAANLIQKKEASFNNPKIPEYIAIIQKENHKLEKNVGEILKVSCNDGENCTINNVDIHKTIINLKDEFSARIEGLEGMITLKLKAINHEIYASPDHIKLIFSNLIDNAIKYSLGKPKIEIKTSNSNNDIQIQVTDNGIGIDKKEQSRIFEKYYRVSTGDIHNVKGFGLGLTYVKKLIEQANGKISVSSAISKGTTFTIVLPLKNEAN